MKLQGLFLLLLGTLGNWQQSVAQVRLSPSTTLLSHTIGNETQTSTWYLWQDTVRRELATIKTTVQPGYQGDKVLIVQQVVMKGAPRLWIDTTVAIERTMAPVYHSSFNSQRIMVLKFNGKQIDGYYKDQQAGIMTPIGDQVNDLCFDSNMYPNLIRFLPLTTGYQAIIPIYDYNPKKHGLLEARIVDVNEVLLTNKAGQSTPCFAVKVTDDISPESQTTHYISKKDRTLLKSELMIGNRRMSIETQ